MINGVINQWQSLSDLIAQRLSCGMLGRGFWYYCMANKMKRINVGVPDYYLRLLDKYALKIGQAQAPAASYLLQSKLDELNKAGELDVPSEIFADFLDVLAGKKELSEIDLKQLSKVSGKPLKELEALVVSAANKNWI